MFKAIVKIIFASIFIFLLIPAQTQARENANYWYIKNFDSEIIVNKDSSLLITEKITADCGKAIDKHGIFRTLPTQVKKTETEVIKTPIELLSITDFNDKLLKYETITSKINHTITWKIGDPDVTVQGENYYKIKYKVKNAVRFDNANFDEFYWNLSGNFWDLEIDKFMAKVIFPVEVTKENTQVEYYTGAFGSKDKSLATYKWLDKNTLEVSSTKTLKKYEGITVSVTFLKNIFTPYQPNFLEKYGQYFWFFIPILVLIFSFLLWSKYGIDPKINPTIAPEFEIPENLQPMEMGMLISDGRLKNNYISAAIVNLAVKGVIKIEKIAKKGFFGKEDYALKLIKSDSKEITESEKLLLEKIFGGGSEIKLSSLRNKFYKEIPSISSQISKNLAEQDLLRPRSRKLQAVFLVFSGIFLGLTVFAFSSYNLYLGFCLAISVAMLFIFSFLIRQRSKKGVELLRKIWGFKLYMDTAEKYRQRFYEKENIFEKFLPYAILFGITEKWIQKMKIIYGEEYYATYHPVWYVGAIGAFDAKSFNSAITDLSQGMASTLSSSPSSSGAGGGGFSGGGGGGGGGGGW